MREVAHPDFCANLLMTSSPLVTGPKQPSGLISRTGTSCSSGTTMHTHRCTSYTLALIRIVCAFVQACADCNELTSVCPVPCTPGNNTRRRCLCTLWYCLVFAMYGPASVVCSTVAALCMYCSARLLHYMVWCVGVWVSKDNRMRAGMRKCKDSDLARVPSLRVNVRDVTRCHPQETLRGVYGFVRGCLSDSSVPFTLYTSPPLTNLREDDPATLLQKKMAPKALIRFTSAAPNVAPAAAAGGGGAAAAAGGSGGAQTPAAFLSAELLAGQ